MTEFVSCTSNPGPRQVIWAIGFVCHIGAFGFVQIGLMDGNSMAYLLFNIVIAGLVCVSLFAEFNIATVGHVLRAHKAWPRKRRALNTTLDVEVQS